jgi:arsenate reductase
MKVYGIKNCSTVKKALAWLDTYQIAYEFHDFKKWGIDEHSLKKWIHEVGLDQLLNKRGTTWKTIPLNIQQSATVNKDAAIKLMLEKTSVIKRPILEMAKGITLGFDEKKYEQLFGS